MTRPTPLTEIAAAPDELWRNSQHFRLNVLRHLAVEPFAPEDTSAGMENELQASVEGELEHIDLASSLTQSSYYKNMMLRAERGDLSPRSVTDLKAFIEDKQVQVWENSWVRFPKQVLSAYTLSVLEHDFLADKNSSSDRKRNDVTDFEFIQKGEAWLRLPISYLLKIALAEATCQHAQASNRLQEIGNKVSRHFISDNISPEITSFSITQGGTNTPVGGKLAAEGAKRFFFTRLLLSYAGKKFHLDQFGQRIHLYFAPTPPLRQKQLNTLISDEIYCDLFLNPCLSGWSRGEAKKSYMKLCHQTLCRSQLNTLAVLKEAGIISNNLVVLPNTSNTSLANNGTHITLGSKVLTECYKSVSAHEGRAFEKYFGDLTVKITEHFLPLFVGTFTAAPYRIGFNDFHPEKVLGYLPHQLDGSHLRMIWRRWKKKAKLSFLGHDFTPKGPEWLDALLTNALRLKGDYIVDNRLIDYMVALRSLEASPALNGTMHNHDMLKKDLFEMGIFNPTMPMYLPFRMRDILSYGFTGFEGRHYSLFPGFHNELAKATDLQAIIVNIAYQLIIDGTISHHHIPDTPFVESERRQIFFNSAIGIPTFYVKAKTGNQFLKQLLNLAEKKRSSKRYKGYIRIEVKSYQQACINYLLTHSQTRRPEFNDTLMSLKAIVDGKQPSAFEKLTTNILACSGKQGAPINIHAAEFNQYAETYFRTELCDAYLREGLHTFITDSVLFEHDAHAGENARNIIGDIPATQYISQTGKKVLAGNGSEQEIHRLLSLFLLLVEQQTFQE